MLRWGGTRPRPNRWCAASDEHANTKRPNMRVTTRSWYATDNIPTPAQLAIALATAGTAASRLPGAITEEQGTRVPQPDPLFTMRLGQDRLNRIVRCHLLVPVALGGRPGAGEVLAKLEASALKRGCEPAAREPPCFFPWSPQARGSVWCRYHGLRPRMRRRARWDSATPERTRAITAAATAPATPGTRP